MILLDDVTGYDNLKNLIPKGQIETSFNCNVKWTNTDEEKTFVFDIEVSKTLDHSERIPHKQSYGLSPGDKDNLFIKISNITDNGRGAKNNIGELCLWLIASPNLNIPSRELNPDFKKGLLYLGYIRTEGKSCFRPFEKAPQGTIIMRILINL